MTGRVVIADGRIAEVTEGGRLPRGTIDFAGDLLAPGLVELHTDNLERHIEPRPRVDWPHVAAIIAHDGELASCGITTVFDALRVGSVVSNEKARYGTYARSLASELLGLRAAGALRIDHFLHLRAEVCSETLVEELAEFGAGDHVGLISLMDHTPGQRQFRDVSKLKEYVCGKHGLSDADFDEHVAGQQALRNSRSRFESGSSNSTIRGSATMARAMATRCWPPDSAPGLRPAMAPRPTDPAPLQPGGHARPCRSGPSPAERRHCPPPSDAARARSPETSCQGRASRAARTAPARRPSAPRSPPRPMWGQKPRNRPQERGLAAARRAESSASVWPGASDRSIPRRIGVCP